MIDELLPPGLGWAERFDDVPTSDLSPAEEAVIARAVETRRREFTTGRWCARKALSGLGFPPAPILPGERDAPGWPAGAVGAITHCAGYRAAVAGRSSAVLTVGVDAEPNAPLPAGVLDSVALTAERRRLASLAAAHRAICWDRLLFSAKESVYKAWFPLARRWLDFEDADVDQRPGAGRCGDFSARLLVDGPQVDGHGPLSGFAGRWLADRGLLLTAIVVPARPDASTRGDPMTEPAPLVCLPFAGSGAGFYRGWAKTAPASVTILPVQLPGREERFLEEPYADVATAVADLAEQVRDVTAGLDRFALFGHSLGAVLAFETARELARGGDRGLRHVYVSGSPGPWDRRAGRATGLPDDEFLARVEEFAGYRHLAFDDPDIRELLLPVLRADVAMHENYRPAAEDRLAVPVTALRGAADALVTGEQARQWRDATTAAFRCVEPPGGHMYLVDTPEAVWLAVAGG